jgi:hypothetical protein
VKRGEKRRSGGGAIILNRNAIHQKTNEQNPSLESLEEGHFCIAV